MGNPFNDPKYYETQASSNPFDDPSYYDDNSDILKSAVGRRQYTARNVEENLAKLQAVKPRDAAHKARIDRLVAGLKKQKEGYTRPVTEKRSAAENVARGVATGFGTTLPSIADLGVSLITPRAGPGAEAGSEQRRFLAEQSEQVKEFYDPQGKAGFAGEVTGAVAAGAVPYGAAASGVAKASGVSEALRAGKTAEGIGARAWANIKENVVGGLPLNALQVSGMEEATDADKTNQLIVATLADIVFGAVGGLRKPKGEIKLEIKDREEVPVEAPNKRAEEAAELVRKAEAKKEAREAMEKLIADKWAQDHPNVPWTAITSKAKAEYRKSVKEEVAKAIAEGKAKPGEGDGGAEGTGGTPAIVPPKPTAPSGIETSVPPASSPKEGQAWLEEALGRPLDEAEQKRVDERGVGGIITFLRPEDQQKLLLAMEKNPPKGVWADAEAAIADEKKPVNPVNEGQGRYAEPEEFYKNVKAEIEVQLSRPLTNNEWEMAKLLFDAGGGEKLDSNPEKLNDAIETVVSQFRDQPIPDISEKIAEDPYKLILEDDLDPDNIAKDWDTAVADAKNFPNSGVAKDLEDMFDQLGFPIEHSKLKWDDLPDYERAKLLEHLQEMKKEGEPEPKHNFDDAVRRVLDDRERAKEWWKALDTESKHFYKRQLGIKYNNWDLLSEEDIDALMTVFESINDNAYGTPNFTEAGTLEVDVGKTVYELSAAERAARQVVPDDLKGELLDLVIDAETQNWDDAKLQSALDDFAARNEVTREQVDQSLRDLGLGEERPVTNLEKGVVGNITEAPSAEEINKDFLVRLKQDIEDPSERDEHGRSFLIGEAGDYVKLYDLVDAGFDAPTIIESVELLSPETKKIFPQVMQDVTVRQQQAVKNSLKSEPEGRIVGQILPDASLARGGVDVGGSSPTGESIPAPDASLPPSPTPKALPDLTSEEIDALKDQLFAALEKDPGNKQLLSQLDELAAETRIRAQARAEAKAVVNEIKPKVDPASADANVRTVASQPVEQGPTRMEPAAFGKLARTSPARLDDATLDALIDETGWRIAELPEGENDVYKQLQDKLLAERARRRPPPLDVHLPPGVGGFAAGFSYGWVTADDEDKMHNALMWGAIGAAGAVIGKKAWNTYELTKAGRAQKKPEMYPGQHSLPKFISYTSERVEKKLTLMNRLRNYYAGLARATGGTDNIVNKLGGANLPNYQNFSSLASIFGRWVSISDHWQTRGPVIDGPDGNPIALPVLSLAKIKDMAKGDIENLDELAVAMTTLENIGKPGWKPPIDIARAQLIFSNAPEHLHQTALELRKYFLALADVMVASGGLSSQARQKFAQEAWYTALHRVIGEGESESWLSKKIGKIESIYSPNPIKPRTGGSTLQVKSPFEVAQEMTSRYLRAAEFNKIKQQFLGFAYAQPSDVRASLVKRIDKKQAVVLGQVQQLADQIRNDLPAITKEEAERMASSFGGELARDAPVMTVYEDGVLRSYRVNQTVFDAFKHLMPQELNAALYFFGGPTRLAAKGIVYHPLFIPMMEFINTFQASLMSKYGFKPGLDSFRGWWAAITNSPQYQKLLASGGAATLQSLPITQKGSARAVLQASGSNPIETAINLVKELHPWEAYKTLVHPLAEASRIGEGLRALNHGESAIDAVYAAWHVTGNNRMQGSYTAMRAFNLLTLFSRPAISATDEAIAKTGLHPFRRPAPSKGLTADMLRSMGFRNDRAINGVEFAMKGFAYLFLPTAMLWYVNRNDEEIRQLRQTSSGRKYWWFRANGQIYKVRKPHVLGQIFGSTVEDLLDAVIAKDPNGAGWLGGLANDAALNVMPQIGVVPISLWANRQIGLGSPIVPEADASLLPEMQGASDASNPARIVADQLSTVSSAVQPESMMGAGRGVRTAMSPAGLDYIVGTTLGMMGQDALLTLDWFINKQRLDMPPTPQEFPVIGRLFGKYPAMNTRPVRDFYKLANQVEVVQKSFNETLTHKPQIAPQYMARHELELQFAAIFEANRMDIAGYRRQIEDMKYMLQNGQMTHEEFRTVEKEILNRIIQIAASTVQMARPLQEPAPRATPIP